MIDWKLLNEAEDDYIKIGDRVYPRSMAKMMGDRSASDILKDTKAEYEKEKEAERVEKERQEKEESAQKFKERMIELRKTVKDEDSLDSWFRVFVPARGKAESLAGEIIRAVMRMEYRYFNDGDVFNFGYGLETAGPAYEFLYEKFDSLENGKTVLETLDDMWDNINIYNSEPVIKVHYAEDLKILEEAILDYLKSHFDDVAVENAEDMLHYELSDEKEKTFEYDWEVPSDVYADIDNGLYEPADLFDAFSGYEYEMTRYGIIFEDMKFEDYSEAKDYFRKDNAWDKLKEYIDELRNDQYEI